MLATVVVTVGLLEGAILALHLVRPLNFLHTNSYNRFRAKPHAPYWDINLNSGGFNDLEFGPKQTGTFRIAALGDSFAFGVVPYGSNYLTLLEEGLRRQGRDVEVLNMGIPSIGPVAYPDFFIDEALSLEPDMVLLSFFVGNDFYETRRRRKYYTYSAVLMSVRYVFLRATKYEGIVFNDTGEYCDTCPTFTPEAYLEIEKKRSTIYWVNDSPLDSFADEAMSYLTGIRDICRDKDISFLVTLILDELQVNDQLRRSVMEQLVPPVQESDWDTTKPNRALVARLAEARIPYKDLLADLQQAARGEPVYRPRDSHWNLAGNRVAARVLEPWVRRQIREPPPGGDRGSE